MSQHVVTVTLDNVHQEVIEESQNRAVLVDFWADWCAPCKNLMPVLEKLAEEYAGQFLLAKINADDQQLLASQFGVRSLPTVMLIKDGQPVDGFAGALSESEVRDFLDQHLPKQWEQDLEQARALSADSDFAAALPLCKSAYEASSQRADIGILYAQVLLGLKRLDEAEAILKPIKLVDQDSAYQQVLAQLELARKAGKSPELESLEKACAAEPDNDALALSLAVQYAQHHYQREALERLYSLLKKNINTLDGEVKKVFTDIVNSLDKGDALAIEFRRKLYTLLY